MASTGTASAASLNRMKSMPSPVREYLLESGAPANRSLLTSAEGNL